MNLARQHFRALIETPIDGVHAIVADPAVGIIFFTGKLKGVFFSRNVGALKKKL